VTFGALCVHATKRGCSIEEEEEEEEVPCIQNEKYFDPIRQIISVNGKRHFSHKRMSFLFCL
jgi:hypothetical protein